VRSVKLKIESLGVWWEFLVGFLIIFFGMVFMLILNIKDISRFKNMKSLYGVAIRVAPENVRARYNYALTRIEIEDYDSAIENLILVKNMSPLFKVNDVLRGIANCYNEKGYIREAKKYYTKVLYLDNDKESMIKLATIYWYEGEIKKARLLLEESLKLGPDALIYNNLGLCYVKEKMYDDAIKSFRRAIELELGYTDAWLNLINLYDMLGDKVMVEFEIDRMARVYSNNGWEVE